MKIYEFWFYVKGIDKIFKRDFRAVIGLTLKDVLNNTERYKEIRQQLREEIQHRLSSYEDITLVDIRVKRCRTWEV